MANIFQLVYAKLVNFFVQKFPIFLCKNSQGGEMEVSVSCPHCSQKIPLKIKINLTELLDDLLSELVKITPEITPKITPEKMAEILCNCNKKQNPLHFLSFSYILEDNTNVLPSRIKRSLENIHTPTPSSVSLSPGRNLPHKDKTKSLCSGTKKILTRKNKVSLLRSKAKQLRDTAPSPSPSPAPPAKQFQEVRVEKWMKPYLDYWEKLEFKLPGETTKGFREFISALRQYKKGTLFNRATRKFGDYVGRKFTFHNWKMALDNTNLALSSDYEPIAKDWLYKKIRGRPKNFLFDNFAKGDYKSLFIRYLESPPEGIEKVTSDENEVMTRLLIKTYTKYHLNITKDKSWKPSVSDYNKFILASKRTEEFFADRKKVSKEVAMWSFRQIFERVEGLWKAILMDMENSDMIISPGFTCSNMTFEKRLPAMIKHIYG